MPQAKPSNSATKLHDELDAEKAAIAEMRAGLEKAAAKFNVGGLLDFIEDQHLGQLASYVGDLHRRFSCPAR